MPAVKRDRFPGLKHSYRTPLYGFWIYFAFDKAGADKLVQWFEDRPAEDNLGGFCKHYEKPETGDTRYVVATTRVKDDADWMVTASHECLHAAYFILEKVGVKHDAKNHEALAYLHSDLFAEMMRQYAEWKTKNADR